MHKPYFWLIALVFFYTNLALSASPTLFCKCTCASNSTLFPLTGVTDDSHSDPDAPLRKRTCIDCNRSLCLEYNLPICKEVKESEISTTCFQRDSAKDQAVVYGFIAMTVGLLAYAALKPFLEKHSEQSTTERRSYNIVSSSGQDND